MLENCLNGELQLFLKERNRVAVFSGKKVKRAQLCFTAMPHNIYNILIMLIILIRHLRLEF